MTPHLFVLLLPSLALGFNGCRSKESKQSSEPRAAASARAAALPLDVPKGIRQPFRQEPAAPPTQEDFEDDAAREITGKNLEEQLDELERELKNQ